MYYCSRAFEEGHCLFIFLLGLSARVHFLCRLRSWTKRLQGGHLISLTAFSATLQLDAGKTKACNSQNLLKKMEIPTAEHF